MTATATQSGRDERDPEGRKPGRRPRRWSPGAILQGVGLTVGLLAMVGGFVLLAFQYRPYSVPSDSMLPTVAPGDTLLAHPVKPADIGRGDVVIFNDPLWDGSDLVKRVVAIGGDTVACCDSSGRISVNGHPITEPYLAASAPGPQLGQDSFSVRVPQGRLFLLGDNRAVSQDSRVHLTIDDGTVPATEVVARVEGVVWPLGDARAIPRTSAFDALPGKDAGGHLPLAAEVWTVLGGAALVLLTAALGTFGGLVQRLRGRRG